MYGTLIIYITNYYNLQSKIEPVNKKSLLVYNPD